MRRRAARRPGSTSRCQLELLAAEEAVALDERAVAAAIVEEAEAVLAECEDRLAVAEAAEEAEEAEAEAMARREIAEVEQALGSAVRRSSR